MKRVVEWARYVAVGGNVVFILWLLYNGIDEGFRARGPELASLVGLLVLLGLNSFLLMSAGGHE